MRFYNSEDRKKEVIEHAAFLRSLSDLYPAIMQVIREFDGKVYNVKFNRALSAAVPGVYSEKRGMFFELYKFENGSVYTLAQCKTDDMKDGKRVNASILLESARSRRETYLKEAYKIESTDMDYICKQLEDIKKMYNAIADRLPYKLRDIYGIQHLY